jgi:hypothetical protein
MDAVGAQFATGSENTSATRTVEAFMAKRANDENWADLNNRGASYRRARAPMRQRARKET